MSFYVHTHFDTKCNGSAYGDGLRVEVHDSWRIRIEMDNCLDYDKHEDVSCRDAHGDSYCARDLSVAEAEQMVEALQKAIAERKDWNARNGK